MIARRVELSLVVKDFGSARTSLDALLIRHRGYAAQLSISGDPSSRGSLQASFRIPVSELNGTLAEHQALGRVERESQSGEEVTMQQADLTACISNALETRVDFATLLLTPSTEFKDRVAELSPSAGTRLHHAFVSGYTDARESLIGLVVWLLSSGPQILLWLTILAAPVFWIWRRWRNLQARSLVA
jgi:hypothetical protein